MDHAANDVLGPIVIATSDEATFNFLELVCQAKGRKVTGAFAAFRTPKKPAIVDRGLSIYGIHHILAYLEDQYPEPPLCLDTPERRAMVRMATEQIISTLFDNQVETKPPVLHALTADLVRVGPFLAGARLTMLDLAMVALNLPSPLWQQHKTMTLEAIQNGCLVADSHHHRSSRSVARSCTRL
jgi:glutathione S-transferase